MKRRSLFGLLCGLFLSAGLAAGSAQAQAPQVTPVPDGMVAIHYYRPAGDYDGWGVHLWESFEKVENGKIVGGKSRSDTPLQGITWMAPMKPTGKDGFGVYWHVKADEFRNTKVNYIIHKGDTKDQCAKDMFWFLPQGRQIFVNQGDCNIYFTLDEAMKARK
jgi:hypothetical protein